MSFNPDLFFPAALSAGAILSGFCGTFLAFRLQREASYYRQVALDFERREARDIPIGLTHFTSALLLLILATICAATFGFIFPLLALHGSDWFAARAGYVVGGMIGSLILLCAYFTDELIHYRIITGRLAHDAREWKSEWWLVAIGVLAAIASVIAFAATQAS
jgi:uncharacterized membrane protein HdeD (DUF308 family)